MSPETILEWAKAAALFLNSDDPEQYADEKHKLLSQARMFGLLEGAPLKFKVRVKAGDGEVVLDPAKTMRESLEILANYLHDWTHDGETLGLESVVIEIERAA